MFLKNIAGQKFAIYAYDKSADAPKTGDSGKITGSISKDAGARSALTDTNPTELDATYFPGVYTFDATQAESNADMIIVQALSDTSGVSIEPLIIYPTDVSLYKADVTSLAQESTLEEVSSKMDASLTEIEALRVILDNPDSFKADVSELATAAAIIAMQTDVTLIRGIMAGNWVIVDCQLLFYDEGGILLKTFNLTRDGIPDSDAPDARTEA